MKIIVVGGGKVGTALCRSLVAENHDVILIEKDESVLNHITKRFDIIGILGNGANFKVLEQADVEDCDIFISMTEYDEVNMVSAVLAKNGSQRNHRSGAESGIFQFLLQGKKYLGLLPGCQS